MLTVQRLNADNTWKINWDGLNMLIDPWLSGSEIDGFRAFNEQWHATPPVSYEEVGQVDLVLISQGYHDHCHPETLEKLGKNYPIAAVPAAYKKLQRSFHNQLIGILPDINKDRLIYKDLQIARMHTKKLLAGFHALVIIKADEYLFFAPHGSFINEKDLAPLKGLKCKALITTFTLYQLPFFLGGKINPGIQQAEKIARLLKPEHILNTHDENKTAKGIANRLAKKVYPVADSFQQIPGSTWIRNYIPIEL